MMYLIAYLLGSGLLIYGCFKRGRANRMNAELVPLLAWGASAVGLGAAAGAQMLLGITVGVLLSVDALSTLEFAWKGGGYALGLWAQYRMSYRLIPPAGAGKPPSQSG